MEMSKSIISEGKTTNEAIEKGLKELNVTKNMVNIKVIDEEKRSFFSILAPRVVKVELTLKDNNESSKQEVSRADNKIEKPQENKEEKKLSSEELEEAKKKVEEFLEKFLPKVTTAEYKYSVEIKNQKIETVINGEDLGCLIGYRGDSLNAFQTILTSIANKNSKSKIKVTLDIENYRDKRKETLENLAIKVSKTVARTGKTITLEPMGAYERKIIHTKLQDNKYVETHSVGEEPRRKVVISKIK